MPSVYHRLGGKAAVEAVVDIFYLKVLADRRVSHFFDKVDMERQIAKQKAFLAVAFGGSKKYTGKRLREAHAPLLKQGLNDGHFDAIAEDLAAALKEFGASEEQIEQVMETVEGTSGDVLGRTPVAEEVR